MEGEAEGMTPPNGRHILTINTGSSSVKVALYAAHGRTPERWWSGQAEGIGEDQGRLQFRDGSGELVQEDTPTLAGHDEALRRLLGGMADVQLSAAGHRVVHGGSRYSQPQRIDHDLLRTLRELIPIDPTHLPQAISAVETIDKTHPGLPQVACFDTAFHRGMPRVAQLYPLPRELAEAGIIRYGFHGLSYDYIVHQLRAIDPHAAGGRLIVAHLGNGASMAAIRGGRGVDTTMGFTPAGGLMMGTRPGDLDPGVLLHLAMGHSMSLADLDDLVNRRSGLLGVSQLDSDMQRLLAAEASNPRAAEAIELFCYQARKFLGALAAVLGGLDTLVFTGGIGEHAASVRQRICQGMEFLGIRLERAGNQANAPVISARGSPVTVRVMPTDEDLMIARHTHQLLWRAPRRGTSRQA